MADMDLPPVRTGDQRTLHNPSPATGSRRRRRAAGWLLVLLSVLIVLSLLPVWARFITFDPSRGRLSPEEHPYFFPVFMIHLTAATIAIVTCVPQVWPALRRRRAAAHRLIGRIYVFGGVVPASLTVLVLTVAWPYSVVTAIGQAFVGLLWFLVTAFAWVLVRQGRIADHRRWMLRSFALTTSVLVNEVLLVPVELLMRTQLDSRLAGNTDILAQVVNATDNWLGFSLSLLFVEWWLDRDLLRRSAQRRSNRRQDAPAARASTTATTDVAQPAGSG